MSDPAANSKEVSMAVKGYGLLAAVRFQLVMPRIVLTSKRITVCLVTTFKKPVSWFHLCSSVGCQFCFVYILLLLSDVKISFVSNPCFEPVFYDELERL